MARLKVEHFLSGLLFVLVIAFLFIISGSLHEQKVIEPGDSAPSFKVTTDSGRTVTRSDFGGKVLVLNFWATWCPPCREEWPTLDAMQKQLASQGVVVVAVSVDKDADQYQQFIKQAHPSFQTVRDPESKISESYGTFQYPETYIIDSDGKVREKLIGAADWTNPSVIARVRRYL